METNLEKAKRLVKAHAAIQGIELPENGYIFEMLELAATPNEVNKNFIKPDVIKSVCEECENLKIELERCYEAMDNRKGISG